MESVAEIQSRFYRNNIDNINDKASIELDEEIKILITGSDYWRKAKENRYKKLAREGHLNTLLELAKMAKEKKQPANWFAKVASKANWDRTMDFLDKLHKVEQVAARVADRVKATSQQMKPIFKAVWKYGESVMISAVTAQESGRDKFRYFCWLIKQKRYNEASYVGK